jgi:Leucine-rich repeat (LRR) protein
MNGQRQHRNANVLLMRLPTLITTQCVTPFLTVKDYFILSQSHRDLRTLLAPNKPTSYTTVAFVRSVHPDEDELYNTPTTDMFFTEYLKKPDNWKSLRHYVHVAAGAIGVRPWDTHEASRQDNWLQRASSQLTRLETLVLQSSRITDLSVLTSMPNLKTLSLCESLPSVCDIKYLSTLTALRTLNMSCNFGVTTKAMVAICSLTALRSLDLSETGLTELGPLMELTWLRELKMDKTNVRDWDGLSCLVSLRHLHLAETEIASLTPLSTLTALRHLDISHTEVMDVGPLNGLITAGSLSSLKLTRGRIQTLSPVMEHQKERVLVSILN